MFVIQRHRGHGESQVLPFLLSVLRASVFPNNLMPPFLGLRAKSARCLSASLPCKSTWNAGSADLGISAATQDSQAELAGIR
jgi:hypothetical protein